MIMLSTKSEKKQCLKLLAFAVNLDSVCVLSFVDQSLLQRWEHQGRQQDHDFVHYTKFH